MEVKHITKVMKFILFLYLILWYGKINWDQDLKPILSTNNILSYERREWTSKWIKYASSSTKCLLISNSKNRYNQYIPTHFGQHLIPIWIGLPPSQYLKFHIPSIFTIFSQIFSIFLLHPMDYSASKKRSYLDYYI